MLNTVSETVEAFRAKMDQEAFQLSEYPVVMEREGVVHTFGSRLMVEIGDTTRYKHRGALTAFAGVDLRANESGDYVRKGNPATKKGSSHQRKTLFQIMEGVLLLVIPSKLSWMKSEPKGSLTKAKYREVEIALQEGKHRDYRYKSCFESAPVICGFIRTEELGTKN